MIRNYEIIEKINYLNNLKSNITVAKKSIVKNNKKLDKIAKKILSYQQLDYHKRIEKKHYHNFIKKADFLVGEIIKKNNLINIYNKQLHVSSPKYNKKNSNNV